MKVINILDILYYKLWSELTGYNNDNVEHQLVDIIIVFRKIFPNIWEASSSWHQEKGYALLCLSEN